MQKKEIRDFILNGHQHYVPHVCIDCAIFGYHQQQLKILLLKNKAIDGFCLPGGYIKRTETLTAAAARIVKERTGIENLFLQQFKTFGDPGRNRIKEFDAKELSEITGVKIEKDCWFLDHTISIGYYAITDFSGVIPQADFMSDSCSWFDVDKIPSLVFDHNEMFAEALHMLRVQLYHYPIGYSLLPKKFTLNEIHFLYETILGKKLDISNFPKKLISLGVIKKLEEKRKIGAHRSPHLYRFDKSVYAHSLKDGLVLS
jgi:8-oxo-dGTP diphosphatase